MSKQLLREPRTFEGPDLTPLLARVHRELGPDAVIVSAVKVRTGGVAGFFSREVFQVVAEEGVRLIAVHHELDGDPLAARLLAIADGVSAAERAELPVFDQEHEESFGSALSRALELDPAPAIASVPAPEPAPTPAADEPTEAMLVDAHDGDGQTVVVHSSRGRRIGRALPGLRDVPRLRRSADQVAPVAPQTPALPLAATREPIIDLTDGSHRNEVVTLESLGLPPDLLPGEVVDDRALLALLDTLPSAPPIDELSGVVAIVGPVDAGCWLAPDGAVVMAERRPAGVAPWLHLDGPGAVTTRRDRWAARAEPVHVVVDADPSSSGRAFAHAAVAAIAPDRIRLVVQARWSAAAVDALITACGGPAAIDAIELVDLDDAADPARCLMLGIPVASIDNEVATPQRWLELLTERLGGR